MSELIITHPGSAHFDEFFAICLILAKNPGLDFRVERREPSKQELDNPAIWVVDIGERLEPERRNFDHHQNIDHPASFVLVSDYLGLSTDLRTLPWFDFTDKIDRFGPGKTGAEIGTNRLRITYSPFEEWYLDLFSSDPMPCLPLMRSFGISMIKNAADMASQFKFWNKCRKVKLGRHTVVIGHTDNSGDAAYNDRLSWERARAVASILHRDGVPQEHIRVEGFGYKVPLVPSAPGAHESRNRRVEIFLW